MMRKCTRLLTLLKYVTFLETKLRSDNLNVKQRIKIFKYQFLSKLLTLFQENRF